MAGFHGIHIEPSGFHRGEYTALAGMVRFKIRRGIYEGWIAQAQIPNSPQIDVTGPRFSAHTLRQLDQMLIKYDGEYKKS